MKNHVAAAAGTMMMALTTTTECFVSTPTAKATRSGSGSYRRHGASSSTNSLRISLGGRSRVPPASGSLSGSFRRWRETTAVTLRLQPDAGSAGTPDAEHKLQQQGAGRRRPPQQAQGKKLSPGMGTIERRNQAEVEELKKNLKRYASLRMWRPALSAFEKARADGLPLNSSTYTTMIHVMAKGARWKEALELLDEMIAGGPNRGGSGPRIAPSVVSYNAAITACARGNKMPAALRVLGEMYQAPGIKPDLYSYGAVLSGLAKARNPGRAMGILEEMREAGLEPDLVCLVSAMEACESKGASKEAALVLEMVRELEPPPPMRTMTNILTSAIAACVTEGAWEQATDWLTDVRMANGGRLPPASAYAAAANACARAGQGMRAKALITELESGVKKGDGERPTMDCYNAVVLGLVMSGDLKGATKTLKEDIPKAGLKPDTQGFVHLMRGYARLQDWETVMGLLDEQRSGKFPSAPPNLNSYNAAIDACGRAGKVRPAIDLLNDMRAGSRSNPRLKPNHYTYGGALNACCNARDGASALDLLTRMKREGIKVDQRCSMAAFTAVSSAGREDDAAQILEDMLRNKVSTSEGALVAAREALVEKIESGVGGRKFARAMSALVELEKIQAEKAAAKAAREATRASAQ